jgi:integrase/recombinase XerD
MAIASVSSAAVRVRPWADSVALEAMVEDYLVSCSVPTARCYRRDVGHLCRYLQDHGVDLLSARRADLAAWVRAQEEAGVAATTIRRRLSGVSGFYRYLENEGVVPRSPAEGLRRPNGAPAPRLGLGAGELACLVEAARKDGKQLELVVVLLVVQGLRVSEACALCSADLVFHEGRPALVIRRKGGRVELVGTTKEVADLIQDVVRLQGPGPLLRGRGGGRLSRQSAWRWVRRLASRAGLDERVFPHLLRHSFVSQALLAGVPLPVVALTAGHKDIRTTLAYAGALSSLHALAPAAVASQIERAQASTPCNNATQRS